MALLSLGIGGWPGDSNGCFVIERPSCFCEGPYRGLVAQPANTFSNFGFIAMGLVIAFFTDRDRRRRAAGDLPQPANLMTRSDLFPSVYAVAVALLGPGSMALHASMTFWGGHVDVASMYIFSGLLIAYAWTRLMKLSSTGFLLLYLGLTAFLVWTKLGTDVESNWIFGLTLAIAVFSEAAVRLTGDRPSLDLRYAALTALLFGAAFAIWLPSRSGGALCNPDTWLQGHALWHLLCAGATGSIFLYLRSERTTASSA